MAASKRKFVRMDSRRRFWLLAGGVAGASVFFSLGVAVGRLWPQADPLGLQADPGSEVRAVAPVTFQGVPREVYTVDEGLRRRATAAGSGSGAGVAVEEGARVQAEVVAPGDGDPAANSQGLANAASAQVGTASGPSPAIGDAVATVDSATAQPVRTLARAEDAPQAVEVIDVPARPAATPAATPPADAAQDGAVTRTRVVTRAGSGGGRPFEFVAVDVSERSAADSAVSRLRSVGLDATVLEIGEPGEPGAFRVVVRGTGDDAEIARQRSAASGAGI